MRDFQNAFDAALAGVDSTIVEVMGISAQFTSGAQRGGEVHGVFDDPESLGFASSGIRIEGSNPSLFVLTDTVCAVRRGDTLTINGESGTISRIDVRDSNIKAASGVKIGTPFSDIYSKAFGNCQKGSNDNGAVVECKAEGSQHISYAFTGNWSGPEELMPSDDTLKNWKVSKIIWRR